MSTIEIDGQFNLILEGDFPYASEVDMDSVFGILLEHGHYPQSDVLYILTDSRGNYGTARRTEGASMRYFTEYLGPDDKEEEATTFYIIMCDDFLALSYDEQHELIIANHRLYDMIKSGRLIWTDNVIIFDGADWSKISIIGTGYASKPDSFHMLYDDLPWIIEARKGLNIGGDPVKSYRTH